MKCKKILWISNLILDISLHKTSQIEILRALARRGHRVFLVASYSSKKMDELEDVNLITVPLKHLKPLSTVAYVVILLLYMPFFLLRLNPDIIIIEPNATIFSLVPSLLLPRTEKTKFVLDIRSTPTCIFGLSGYLNLIVFNIALYITKKFFQGITIITNLMKKEVSEEYNINPEHIGVWTSGVSPEAFRSEKYCKADLRKKLNLEDRFVVFYHGNLLEKNRGIEETVRAIKILKKKYPKILLFLLGNADHRLKNQILKLGVQDRVILHESVNYEEVPKYVAACDVGIIPLKNLPVWRYQCPLKLLEYLAMKKVVTATDIPAHREILGKSKCVIYISSADPKEIAEAICYAYDNRKFLTRWGTNGREIIEEKYTWDKVAGDLENYILHL